jgi:transposase
MNQKKILQQWITTSRYVYNRALDATKKGEKMNFFALRNKFVTAKNNPLINSWELNTPKDIRAEAIKDMTKAFNVAMINLRKNNINDFNLKFRTKKKESSIAIPSSAVKIENGKLLIYKSYTKTGIKLSKDKSLKNIKIHHDCRLKNDNGEWFFYIPIDVKLNTEKPIKVGGCALDPGKNKFQTVYSEEETIKIGIKTNVIEKLQRKLDLLQSLRSRKYITKSHYVKKSNKLQSKFKNLVDDLHFQSISYLTKTFKTIFIPKFESQELIRINKSKKFRRTILGLKHFTFRERLISKSKLKEGCLVKVCTEEFTSKTCSGCGNIDYKLGSNQIYECKKCPLVLDRDVNGARNIYIKMIKEIQNQRL